MWAREQGKDAAQMDTCVDSMTNYYNKCKKFLQTIFWLGFPQQTIFFLIFGSANNFFDTFWYPSGKNLMVRP